MLRFQYSIWAGYPQEFRERIEIVVVDDGSPGHPASTVARPIGLPSLKLFRVLVDKPWNQHGARNLGAKQATGPWLFLTDIDHVLPTDSLAQLLLYEDQQAIYMFHRMVALDIGTRLPPSTKQICPHPNTFAMTQTLYWQIGGYDEDYCGVYGTDSLFRERALAIGKKVHLNDVPVVVYTPRLVADASTKGLDRDKQAGKAAGRQVRMIKAAESRESEVRTLNFPWERVL